MAEMKFLGFKEVLLSTFNSLSAAEKVGYIWFVKSNQEAESDGDIYLGARHYGRFSNNDVEIEEIKTQLSALTIDVQEIEGVAMSAKTVAEGAQTIAEEAKEGADEAKNIAVSAKTVAEGIEDIAVEAKDIATSAKTVADDAQTVAEEAKETANEVMDIAASAKTIAEDAQTVAEEAKEAADEAKDVAVSAKTVAEGIEGIAVEAKEIAEDAQNVALSAQTVAEGAQALAEEAKDTADDAKDTAVSAKTIAEDAQALAEEAKDGVDEAKAAAASAQTAAEAAQATADDLKEETEAFIVSAQTLHEEIIEEVSGQSIAIAELQEEIESIVASAVTYEAGEGIEISGSVISANADAVTTDDIQVTVDLGAGFSKNTTIPAGTSIQDLLVKLLSKELWDTTAPSTSTAFTVSLASGFAVTLDKSGNVEVGDEIKVNKLNAKATSTHTQSYTVSKFDYGFKIGADGAYNSATANTVSLTPTKTADGNVLSEIFSKFKDAEGSFIEDIEDVKADSLDALTVYASEGVNKVTAKQSGDTYASVTAASETYYVATNLKNYTKSSADTSDNTYVASPTWATSKMATGSSEASVTGCYKYYYGYTAAADDYSTLFTSKASLSTLTGAFMTGATAEITKMTSTNDKSSLVLVLPATYTITGTKNSLGSDVDIASTWVERNTFDYVNGNKTTSYKVYVKHSAEGIMYQNITFKK